MQEALIVSTDNIPTVPADMTQERMHVLKQQNNTVAPTVPRQYQSKDRTRRSDTHSPETFRSDCYEELRHQLPPDSTVLPHPLSDTGKLTVPGRGIYQRGYCTESWFVDEEIDAKLRMPVPYTPMKASVDAGISPDNDIFMGKATH